MKKKKKLKEKEKIPISLELQMLFIFKKINFFLLKLGIANALFGVGIICFQMKMSSKFQNKGHRTRG